tara:strand:+ start:1238 stop:1954 length:717 start_codon:yes stop_codon:yes gene_type:complete
MSKEKTKILILAGGKGERFNPFSFVIPKPLMPLKQNPIIMHLINSFKKNNFKNFLISTGYQSELIKAYLGSGKKFGVKIKYFEEKKPLGTAGPIRLIKNQIKKREYFFLINGDVFTKLNFKKMLNFAKKGDFDLVAGYVRKNYRNSFGVLNIKKNLVKNIIEKPSNTFEISAGIYLIKNTKNLNLIPNQKYFTMPDLIQKYLSKKLRVGAYKIDKYWLSIENMQNLLKLEKKINTKIK